MNIRGNMRAVMLTGHGGLDKLDYREDWPAPESSPGEVLVRVGACGLNYTDINTRTAWYSKSATEGIADEGGKQGFGSADNGVGSGDSFMPLVDALRQGGRYSSSGAISGPLVEFDLRQLIYKDLQLTGTTIVPPGTMRRPAGLIERDLLEPLLAKSFPLRDLATAQEACMQKKRVGNIVVEAR